MKSENRPTGEWFKEWFDEYYPLVYAHRNEDEAERFASLWPIWKDIAAGGRCLDLGCGNGRFAKFIMSKGIRPVGIDLSRAMLKTAAERHIPEARFIRCDLRAIPSNGPFSLAISMFTSFGYFEKEDEHQKLLNRLAEILDPGGFIVLDLLNKPAAIQFLASNAVTERTVGQMKIRESRYLNIAGNRIVKEILIEDGTGRHSYMESVRLFTPEELASMTSRAGFAPVVPLWGEYDGSPFNDTSSRMIYFGRKNG